jgi:nickel-dependent lactate racemase
MKTIPYGESQIALDMLPLERFEIVKGAAFISERPEVDVYRDALEHPVSGLPLIDRLHPGMKVVIIIPDRTRVCGSERFLPWILETILTAGLTANDVVIMFALGTHEPQPIDEQKRLVGEGVWGKWRVMEPNCRDETSLVKVGVTPLGTEVFLNHRVAEADLVILCGAVTHHYFAGMGGGPKLVLPGVAGETTIFTNHRRAISPDGTFCPDCQDGKTKGNPLAEDILEAAKLAPPIYHIGLVLDDEGRIGKAFGGDLETSHQATCDEVKILHEIPVKEKRPVIVVSPGGHPRDINFIQSHKALQHASYALDDGGVMILVAKCPEGMGSDTFLSWMKHPTIKDLTNELTRRYTLHGHTALSHRTKLERIREICVSDMASELVRELGMIPAASLSQAWSLAQEFLPLNWNGYIIPNGFIDIPFYRKVQ